MTELRIKNVSTNAECRWCIDGLAEIGTRPEGRGHLPMFAPCPYCEAGFRFEFPTGAPGPRGTPGVRARWGHGYWQGRDHAREVVPPARSGAPLSREANLRLAREMLGALDGGAVREMP